MKKILKHIYKWLTDKNYRWWNKYSSFKLMSQYYDLTNIKQR